jgi:hypothetical protein
MVRTLDPKVLESSSQRIRQSANPTDEEIMRGVVAIPAGTPQVAFKEWAGVCAALCAGRQSIILRKGGIDEGPAGFQPQYESFWLLATQFHQHPEELTAEGASFLEMAAAWQPGEGHIVLPAFARVVECRKLTEWRDVVALEGEHIWSEGTLIKRFTYKTPGLTLLRVELTIPERPMILPTWPELAGCKSWVPLPV